MQISPVNNLNFSGSVYLDKIQTAKEIAKISECFPQISDIDEFKKDEQVQSFIGNINTLKSRLQQNTPDINSYEISFNLGCENNYSAFVTVYDRNNEHSSMSYVDLCQHLSSVNLNVQRRASGERIFESAFKPVYESVIKRAYGPQKHTAPNSDEPSYLKRELKQLSEKEKYVFDRLI